MTRVFAAIWLTAFALAGACILLLLMTSESNEIQYPDNFATAIKSEIVFIGSSLTGHGLPAEKPVNGILDDNRPSKVFSVPDISERITNKLLEYAIGSGAQTVFVEINAYSHEQIELAEPAFLSPMVLTLRDVGEKLTFTVKRLLHQDRNPYRTVQVGSQKTEKTLDKKNISQREYYRFHKTEPARKIDLQTLLIDAEKANVEVFFFSPPRPQSAIDMMGVDHFDDLNSHLEQLAASHGRPLWYSPIPWPDDHFMDILAHANARGRARFRQELADWYSERQ